MNALIVYAHPNPDSFNRAILNVALETYAERGVNVRVVDLYAEKFNPVLDARQLQMAARGELPDDIRAQQQDVSWADVLVVIYPLWWFDRPAILKGWFDRVFTNGFAFEYREGRAAGLLPDKRAIVIVTAGGTEDDFGKNASQLTRATTEGTLAFCGIRDIADRVFYAVPMVSEEERVNMLNAVRSLLATF